MEELAKGKAETSQETIQQIHEIITQGILTDGGKYRTQNVRVMGARKTPPDFSKIPSLMSALIKNMSKKGQNPVEIASFFHHRLVEIHPFIDGNGRVARLLTNLYLLKKGYSNPLINPTKKCFSEPLNPQISIFYLIYSNFGIILPQNT
jgi:Fic family protein